MNKAQRWILIVALLVAVAMVLYPPHVHAAYEAGRDRSDRSLVGQQTHYAPILDIDDGAGLAAGVLAVQFLVLGVVTGILLLLVKPTKESAMKRTVPLILAVGLAALSFGAGAAATKAAKKFPWASDELNKPCDKTVLEWMAVTAKIDATAVSLTPRLELTRLVLTPGDKGILVEANIEWKPPYPTKGIDVERTLRDAMEFDIPKQIAKGGLWKPDHDHLDWECRMTVAGKPYALWNRDGFQKAR